MIRLIAILVICVCVPLCTAQQSVFVTPAEIKGEEGNDFTFVCHSFANDPDWYSLLNESAPVKLVTTDDKKYDVFVQINDDNTTSLGYLIIRNAVPEDSGKYQCKQDNAFFNVNLEVYPIKQVEISPQDPEFIEGSDLLLNCTVNGATDQQVSWTINKGGDIEVPSAGDDASHIQVYNNGSLIIRVLTPEDAGIYYCTHTFPQGEETAMVSVGGDITLTAEKSVKYTEGDRALIECEAHVLSPVLLPNITWFVNGTALEESGLYKDGRVNAKITAQTEHTKTSTLEILKITMDDRMNYTCFASNGATEASKDILLRVRDRLAALWPFLGIVCEVVILIVIIFIHEKCSKGDDIGEDDEDDDDLKKEKEQINDGDGMKSSNQ